MSGEARAGRGLEIIAVLILGLATIGSAWSAYQSSQWGDVDSRRARDASDLKVESSRLFGLATQRVAYDATIVSQYAAAVASGENGLREFIRTTLVRPEFLPILDRWESEVAAGATDVGYLLDDQAYLDEQLAPSRTADERAAAAERRSHDAADTSGDYLLSALIMAAALFLSGVTTSFRSGSARAVLTALAAVVLAYGAARLADLPVT